MACSRGHAQGLPRSCAHSPHVWPDFPVGELHLFGSARSAGTKVPTKFGEVTIEDFSVAEARKMDVVSPLSRAGSPVASAIRSETRHSAAPLPVCACLKTRVLVAGFRVGFG